MHVQNPPETPRAAPASALRRRFKRALFALTPVTLLLVVAEVLLRLFVAAPEIVPFSPEVYEDRDLFWRVRPNLDTTCVRGDKPLKTNSFGFRDREIDGKAPGEFRILCLGESTTYGDYVEPEESYVRLAEGLLNRSKEATSSPYRLINAAAPSYSSFQSLIMLKKHGLPLKPDAVLLYHEGNDYLPAGWGDVDARGQSDPERSRTLQSRPWLWWLTRLHLYRVPMSLLGRRKTDPRILDVAYNRFGNRVQGIATRLTAEEQLDVLREFADLCRREHIQLWLIHPTYRATTRHVCPLTQFAADNSIPLLETFDLFADAKGRVACSLFVDPAHPTAEGHRRMAEALVDFIETQRRSSARSASKE